MPAFLFWLFAVVMLGFGVAVVINRNPIASALSLVLCFMGLSALFMSLDAFFIGIIQVLVYAGAVMVLFLFIIMLLDLKNEEHRANKFAPIAAGLALSIGFLVQLVGVLSKNPNKSAVAFDQASLTTAAANFPADGKIAASLTAGQLPDVHLIGHTLFTQYNFPLQILGVLLLVATIGVVTLSKRQAD